MARYRFVFECAPGDSRPAAARIKKLLKFALRVCALRCIEVAPDEPNNEKRAAVRAKEQAARCIKE